jgi:hypothetical protein
MDDAKINIASKSPSAVFGHTLKLASYWCNDRAVGLTFHTETDEFKILCSPEWAEHLAEVLKNQAKQCRNLTDPIG